MGLNKVCVDKGVDMFGNIVTLGQRVLFNRADPGGVGIGIITNIYEYTKDDGTQIFSRNGYMRNWSGNYVDKCYEYQLRTLGKRNTEKREYEIIGKVDENILNSIRPENSEII